LEHLEGVVGENLEKRIVTERIYTHRDFAADYNAFRGTAFGLAHTLGQTAIFRPRNYSRKVNNLYYAGQYTNPGVGVPVGLISAQIVASLVEKEI
jgi:phytoene desaturase